MIPVKKHPIGQLQEITCYVYYNGPNLSSLRNEHDDLFLGVWVESTSETDIFIYLAITQLQEKQLNEEFSNEGIPSTTTLIRSIMLKSSTFYKIQFFRNGEEIFEECFESVPEKWLVGPVE